VLLWVCVFSRELSLCDQVNVLLFVDVCVSERLLTFFYQELDVCSWWVGGLVQNFMQNELARSPVFTGVS